MNSNYLVLRIATIYTGRHDPEDHCYIHKWFPSKSEAKIYIKQINHIIKDLQSINDNDKHFLHELKNTIRFRYVTLDKVRKSYILETTGDIYQPDLPLNLHKNTKHWIELDKISSFDGLNYKKYPKHLRKQAKIAISNTHSCYVLYNEKLQLFGREIGEDEDGEEIQEYVASKS